MSYMWFFYLVGVFSNMSDYITIMSVLSLIAFGLTVSASGIAWMEITNDNSPPDKILADLRRARITTFWFSVVLVMLRCITPDEDMIKMMATTKVAEVIASTPTVQQLGSDVVDVMQGYLKKAKEGLDEGPAKK